MGVSIAREDRPKEKLLDMATAESKTGESPSTKPKVVGKPVKKIGYLAQVFPHLTMTFVYREVMSLREAGLPVPTFSIWQPEEEKLSADAKPLVESTYYIFPLHILLFLRAHLFYALCRPHRYWQTLRFSFTAQHSSWHNRWRTVRHFAQALPLAAEVERRGIEHLHVHFALNATTLALFVARLADVTYSFTAHANDIFCNPILLPEKIRGAKFIVAISEFNRRFLHDVVPTSETLDKIHVIHCGIDTERFALPTPEERDAQPDGPPTIVAVGRLVEKKGFPYLVDACKLLVDRGYDFRCSIIGPEGPEQMRLEQMIAEHNLQEYVELKGVVFQEQMRKELSRATVVTLPCVVAQDNDMDGIPYSLMEGMAMGVPAVSTQVSGIPELIDGKTTGLLAPPRDAEALADAIAQLLDDPSLRQRLGQGGRKRVLSEFELEKNSRELQTLFESYLVEPTD